MAQQAFERQNSSDLELEDIPILNESLQPNNSSVDSNKSRGKYGYDFFSTMATSTSAVGDLPLPNDYKISFRDQLTVILSGSRDAIFDLSVKLDGTILFPELGSQRRGLWFCWWRGYFGVLGARAWGWARGHKLHPLTEPGPR